MDLPGGRIKLKSRTETHTSTWKIQQLQSVRRSEEKSGLRTPFQNARERCSCWAGCLRGQRLLCAITRERSSSVVLARRTRPDVGASQVGSNVLTRHFPKGGWEVKGDQKIVVWQGHAPEPTVRTTVPQKPYTSLGSRDSASEVLCFPNTGWLKTLLQGALTQPVAKSCGLIMDQLLEGGMPAHVCVDTDTQVYAHTHVCTSVYSSPSCSVYFDLQCQNKTPLSAGFMSKQAYLHHSPGLWIRQRGHVTFSLFYSESPLYHALLELR